MEVIKIQDISISQIIDALKKGKVIVYPTETCYGLGCDATNSQAVDKLFEIKKRQKEKAVLVLVSDVSVIEDYVKWTPKLEELKRKYWPGPLTVVTKIKNRGNLSDGTIDKDNTIAFRITDHYFAHALCKELGRPLVSTSANITSHDSPYNVESILEMFEGKEKQPDIIIDSGTLPHKSPSTIIRVKGNEIELLRQGELILNL
jgi:L-threonylcarbamoyladenylate synthase